MADVAKRALYFGCYQRIGHCLVSEGRDVQLHSIEGFPWDYNLLDAGLLINRKVPDEPNGVVHWVAGGNPLWIGFFWWDRSGDKRSNSNSGFYVQGFDALGVEREHRPAVIAAAFEFASQQWPDVVARQSHPLVLQLGIDEHRKESTRALSEDGRAAK